MVHEFRLVSECEAHLSSSDEEIEDLATIESVMAGGIASAWGERFLAGAPSLDEAELARLRQVLQLMGR
ncbi:hypothetical protein [Streptomyces sp. NPDC002588]|uniref:hypothetical protein n=1 Tax=Streptomyces sp. NPDC002588 TaxID=3154419 RepID=UPI003316ABDB